MVLERHPDVCVHNQVVHIHILMCMEYAEDTLDVQVVDTHA